MTDAPARLARISINLIFVFLSIGTYTFAAYNTIFRINGYGIIELGYSVAGIGDVNNDAIPDFIVASQNQSRVYIYSGANAAIIDSIIGVGNIVAGVGKIDTLDNIPDFAVGDPVDSGKVRVFSGSNRNLIYTITGTVPGGKLGNAIAKLGDIHGSDGRNEFVIGWAGYGGSIKLVSGINGSTICDITNGGQGFGSSVAGGGNVMIGGGTSTSGNAEALLYQSSTCCIAKDYNNWGGWSVGVAGNKLLFGNPLDLNEKGSVFVFPIPNDCPDTNFADTSLFKRVSGTQQKVGDDPGQQLGFSVAGLGSTTDNFVAGSPYADSMGIDRVGKVSVYNPLQDTIPIYQKEGQNALDRLGFSVAELGDIDGDGVGDFIAGALSRPACCQGPGYALVFVSGCSSSIKGDLNGIEGLTPADVVLELNYVFSGTGTYNNCVTDMDCNGLVTPSDVVHILRATFSGLPSPC